MTISNPEEHRVEFVQILPGSTHSLVKENFLTNKRISARLSYSGEILQNIGRKEEKN